MSESDNKFARKLMEGRGEEAKPFTSERQLTAQAFNLHVAKRDGLHSEGFAWSHYANYKWTDEGNHERLVILFGPRAVEIEGHNLGLLVEDIREGKLNGVQEMVSAEAELRRANGDEGAIISSVKTHPDFEEIFKEIKGDDREPGFAGKVRGR